MINLHIREPIRSWTAAVSQYYLYGCRPVQSVCAQMSRAKHWCFTSFDEAEPKFNDSLYEYLVYGREICPRTERPHWQAYVAFKNRVRLPVLRANLGEKNHYEPMRGTSKEASDYCKKDGQFTEWGSLPEDGRRAGAQSTKRLWEQVRSAAQSGDYQSIPDEIYVRYVRNIHYIADYQLSVNAPPNYTPDTLTGLWIYGPPGIGKSHWVREYFKNIYIKEFNKWWDGYKGQKEVLLDDLDFTHKWISNHLKIWADRYAFRAEKKGSTLMLRPRWLIVTSNYSIGEIWPDDATLQEAIKRRFHVFNPQSREDLEEVSRFLGCLPIAQQEDAPIQSSSASETTPSKENS